MSNLTLQSTNEFYLKAISGKLKGTVFRLSSNEISIGRDPSNHISVPEDTKLSRKHARLILNDGKYFVQNLSSKNFIRINNEQVSQSELKNNYIFSLGDQSFKFISVAKNASGQKFGSPSPAKQASRESNKNITYVAAILIMAAAGYMYLLDPHQKEKKSLREIATTEKILNRVEKNTATNAEILKEIQDSGRNTKAYKDAHAFYIKGFRDFQKGLYSSALSSFETCLSLYPSHQLARRYSELASNRTEELIAFNMNQGMNNMRNGKNDFCISSFRNVMSQVNDVTDTRYIEAKQLMTKCKILKRSKY